MVNRPNIQNNLSELYIALYHELHHVKDTYQLAQNIDIANIPHDIRTFQNQDQMALSLGYLLWSEYYAYKEQFTKYNSSTLKEQQLSEAFKNIAAALVAYRDEIHKNNKRTSLLLNNAIYEGLYNICAVLAYKTVNPDYELANIFLKAGRLLHVNLMMYVNSIYNILTTHSQFYPKKFTANLMSKIGIGFMLFYKFLCITISFEDGLALHYDHQQPLLKWIDNTVQ